MGETGAEEVVGELIVEGQRYEMWVSSSADEQGTWHNTLRFRRDGVHSPLGEEVVGVEWHVAPRDALNRALGLPDSARLELFRKSLRPRPPVA